MKTSISLKPEGAIGITIRSVAIKPMPNDAGFLVTGNERNNPDKPIAAFSTAQEVLTFLGSLLLPKTEITFVGKEVSKSAVSANIIETTIAPPKRVNKCLFPFKEEDEEPPRKPERLRTPEPSCDVEVDGDED